MIIPLLFWLAGNPFWMEKPPSDWTDVELQEFFVDSPWARTVAGPARTTGARPVQVYLATAAPVVEAEKERDKRAKAKRKPGQKEVEDPLAEEYRAWFEDNHESQIVIAIKIGMNPDLSKEAEVRHMEEDSFMQIGRKKIKISGHFPPTPSDPFLRMAFPRQPIGDEKKITFSLYIPGLPLPFREAEFHPKDMVINGKPEF